MVNKQKRQGKPPDRSRTNRQKYTVNKRARLTQSEQPDEIKWTTGDGKWIELLEVQICPDTI